MEQRSPFSKSFSERVPDGDNLPRQVCDHCGFIHYDNAKIVVGIIATWEGKLLFCKRAIGPRSGYWTFPAGFMEQGESSEEGARREAIEEANAEIEIDALIGIYNIPHISQVQIIYRGKLVNPDVSPGPESSEVRFCTWDEVPWDDLAFPSIRWALQSYRKVEGLAEFPPFLHTDHV